ncbi:MAG: hypothetical protein AAF467_06520 [Actinomycetota bacterium]
MAERAGTADDGGRLDWGPLRRVHFYVSDLIARDLGAFGVYVPERRVFEALHFGESVSHQDGVSIAAICGMLPENPPAQTVASTLERMRTQGWVEQLARKSVGPHGGRLWALTDDGRGVRDRYKQIVEVTLREFYSDATNEELSAMLKNGRAALALQNELLVPVADPSSPSDPPSRSDWGALRVTHFNINDQLLARAKSLGVDVMERRMLDYVAFAHHRGAPMVSSAGVSAMVPGNLRIQSIEAVLDRMVDWEWVSKTVDTPRGSRRSVTRWCLTDQGRSVRDSYKRWAERTTAQVYAGGHESDTELLLSLAAKAERHRNLRLEPIVTMEIRQLNEES